MVLGVRELVSRLMEVGPLDDALERLIYRGACSQEGDGGISCGGSANRFVKDDARESIGRGTVPTLTRSPAEDSGDVCSNGRRFIGRHAGFRRVPGHQVIAPIVGIVSFHVVRSRMNRRCDVGKECLIGQRVGNSNGGMGPGGLGDPARWRLSSEAVTHAMEVLG